MAEPALEPTVFLNSLNRRRKKPFQITDSFTDNIQIFVDFSPSFMEPVAESKRYTIRRFKFPICLEYFLVVVHLPSKLHRTPDDQAVSASLVTQEILRTENLSGHRRTILVGDFNMDPFEAGMMKIDSFHSISSKDVINQNNGTRTYMGNNYPFFYNPMWNFYGDVVAGYPGTYFYNSGGAINHYWHMFDQVLLRPDLIDDFQFEKLQIVDHDGEDKLVNLRGQPDPKKSDHLPLSFQIRINLENTHD